jgi:hypothetical protein
MLVLMGTVRPARAQTPATAGRDSLRANAPSAVACAGQIVTAIDVTPMRPPFRGASGVWRAAARGVGLHHVTTKADVVAGYVQLRVGEPCDEFRRAESERVLRAQPFLAAATVRPVPDGGGGVRIEVTTVDEVPAIIRGRLRGVRPQSLTLGNENVGGEGVRAEVHGELGRVYRDGIGIRVTEYALFHGPYTGALEAERRPLGSLVGIAVSHPFYTDRQPTAWHVGYRDDHDFRRVVRPAGDALALSVRETRWEVGGLHRRRLLGHVGAVGFALTGLRNTPAQAGVVVSDSGLAPDTGVALRGRYAPFRVVRPAVLVGGRVVRFVTVRGVNTLTALEDLPSGVQAGALLGRGVRAWGASDVYVAGTLYAGHATPTTLVALQLEIEGRRDDDIGAWNGLIASGRLAWLRQHAARRTFALSEEFSGGSRAQLPLQLTFQDRVGGLRGLRRSTLSGAWRNVVRLEERWVRAAPVRRADVGVAGFTDLGTIWAGSAPYGQTVPLRASLGASVLAAYPAGSRRVLRVDVAASPRRDGSKGWEVRFSGENLTRVFWREPADVTRARTGPVPSSLFTWPVR